MHDMEERKLSLSLCGLYVSRTLKTELKVLLSISFQFSFLNCDIYSDNHREMNCGSPTLFASYARGTKSRTYRQRREETFKRECFFSFLASSMNPDPK